MTVLALELVPFEGIAFLWFVGVVRDRIGQREDRFFATVFLGSGLLFVALLFVASAVTAAFLGELAARTGSPKDVSGFGRRVGTVVLHTYAVRMVAVFIISTATIGLRTRFIPLWLSVLRLHDRSRPAPRRRHHTMGRADFPCLDPAPQSRHTHQESRGRAAAQQAPNAAAHLR